MHTPQTPAVASGTTQAGPGRDVVWCLVRGPKERVSEGQDLELVMAKHGVGGSSVCGVVILAISRQYERIPSWLAAKVRAGGLHRLGTSAVKEWALSVRSH